ncbi:MAG: acyltransferase family protein [Thermodesulfobacteriota bacterium]
MVVKERFKEIDLAKGLAIFLVVVGHIVARQPYPSGNEWYTTLKFLIYKFHMPFFMFISGFVMLYSYKSVNSILEYVTYVKNKFLRLMVAFFFFGIIVGISKYALRNYMYIDNVTANPIQDYINLLINPMHSYSASLWYVYVLFIYFIIIPPILYLIRGKLEILLFLGLVVHFLPAPNYFAIDLTREYLFVFSLGMLCSRKVKAAFDLVEKYRLFFIICFVVSFALAFLPIQEEISKLIIGCCSIPAIFSIIRFKFFSKPNFWNMLGRFTFPIYLMNTIAIGFAKGVLFKFVIWDGINFLFFAPILLISGLFVPIFIKKQILARNKLIDSFVA